MSEFKSSAIWKNAFLQAQVEFPKQCKMLETAFDEFRERTKTLVSHIQNDMPQLTVHDISHLDALWWTASEIAGENYQLNPAEAFVLGGAMLLHDAAHCLAAYPGGIAEIVNLPEWSVYKANLNNGGNDESYNSPEFQAALFDFLRVMHPKQARKLPKLSWKSIDKKTDLYLIPNDNLRDEYGDIIGLIAESHWLYPYELEKYSKNLINPSALLHPAPWPIDILKLCVILRVADAAHINSQRAPKFLFALTKPSGISLIHWQFQNRIHNVKRDPDSARHEVRITSTAFPPEQQDAWWMAYDVAGMIDKELRAADRILLDFNRARLAARSVAYVNSPEDFSRNVPTDGWQPVDTSIKITDIRNVVERFGGEHLYGKHPSSALREIIQNAVDAVHACRSLEGLSADEGEIEVSLRTDDSGTWLTVSDTGVGMSRYVLTDVLLDFGKSLWGSQDLRAEWEFLPGSGFKAIGQFGIGFFSIFMLGERVRIVTRRFDGKVNESPHWILEFIEGTRKRPTLRLPTVMEKLKRHGTQISVLLADGVYEKLLDISTYNKEGLSLSQVCGRLAPAIDVNMYVKFELNDRELVVRANDWHTISATNLLRRLSPLRSEHSAPSRLIDIVEGSKIKARVLLFSTYGFQSFLPRSGVGVTRGIKAGSIEGVEGIIHTNPQSDLARASAEPDITKEELIFWANKQKMDFIEHGDLSVVSSALLLQLGVSPGDLLIGRFCGEEMTLNQFLEALEGCEEIIIYSGEVSYDEDDRVPRYEFDDKFERADNLLEICDIDLPEWMENVLDFSLSDRKTVVDVVVSAIESQWGEVDVHTYYVTVGRVGDIEIVRGSTIVSPVGVEN